MLTHWLHIFSRSLSSILVSISLQVLPTARKISLRIFSLPFCLIASLMLIQTLYTGINPFIQRLCVFTLAFLPVEISRPEAQPKTGQCTMPSAATAAQWGLYKNQPLGWDILCVFILNLYVGKYTYILISSVKLLHQSELTLVLYFISVLPLGDRIQVRYLWRDLHE